MSSLNRPQRLARGGWEDGNAAEGTAGSAGVALQLPAEDDAWLAESDPSFDSSSSGGIDARRNLSIVSQSSKESAHVPPTAPLGLEDLNLELLEK